MPCLLTFTVTLPFFLLNFDQDRIFLQFIFCGTLLFFSFAWESLKGGVAKEKEDITVEKEIKEEEKEGHFNVANTINETDPVSKLSAEEGQEDSRGT